MARSNGQEERGDRKEKMSLLFEGRNTSWKNAASGEKRVGGETGEEALRSYHVVQARPWAQKRSEGKNETPSGTPSQVASQ